jgi:hypothetical protein
MISSRRILMILLFVMTFPLLNEVQRNALDWFLKAHFVILFKVACVVTMAMVIIYDE